jgi:hypothetical protein
MANGEYDGHCLSCQQLGKSVAMYIFQNPRIVSPPSGSTVDDSNVEDMPLQRNDYEIDESII